MGFCYNCTCDDCYFELNPMYGPVRLPECCDCGKTIQWGHSYCQQCVKEKWMLEVRSKVTASPHLVSKQDYERMMKEAQE